MAKKRELTCINCPLGCTVVVQMDGDEILSISGNTCKRGETYARMEVTNPTRMVTTSVPVDGSESERMVSVKTAAAVPKDLIFNVMDALQGVRLVAPVAIGDVVLANVCGTGVDVVATRNA